MRQIEALSAIKMGIMLNPNMRISSILGLLALVFSSGCRDEQRVDASESAAIPTSVQPMRDLAEYFGERVNAQEVALGYKASLQSAHQALLSSEDGANEALLNAAAIGIRASISERDRSTSMALLALALSRAPELATKAEIRALLRMQKTLAGTDLGNAASMATHIELDPRHHFGLQKAATLSVHSAPAALLLAEARLQTGAYDDTTLALLKRAEGATQDLGAIALIRARLALGFADPEEALELLQDVPGTGAQVMRTRAAFLMETQTSSSDEERRDITIAEIERLRPLLKFDALFWRGQMALDQDNVERLRSAIRELLNEPDAASLGTLLTVMEHLDKGLEESALILLRTLSDEDFRSPDHRALWRWCKVRALGAKRKKNERVKTEIIEATLEAERFDGDRYRGALARAAITNEKAMLSEAFLYAPFEGALADYLGKKGSRIEQAIALRGARRAMAFSAPSYARARLAKHAPDCVPCSALLAIARKDKARVNILLKQKEALGKKDLRDLLAF